MEDGAAAEEQEDKEYDAALLESENERGHPAEVPLPSE